MKKFVIMVVVVGSAGAAWYFSQSTTVAPPPEVLKAAVSRGHITETVQATGTIEPQRRVNVGSPVSGLVKEIYADFNSVVKQGDLLAEIDPTLFEMQVQIQEAAIERQNNDIATQEMQLRDLQRQRARVQELYDKGLQPIQQLEVATLSVKMREAQLLSARKQLVQAEASLAAAKLNLSYTKIFSPIDGVVVNRRVDRGQTVQASMSTPNFFMLSTPLQTLKLTAYVDEADIGRVRPGMTVRFRVNTFGQELFDGSVDAVRLNASNNNSVVTYPVWISVPNDDLRLRPGMTATCFIEVSSAVEVLRLPNDALRFRPTRAIYQAFGKTAPDDGPVRAVDLAARSASDKKTLRDDIPDDAQTIDQLFAPLPRADARGTVWTWRPATKEFVSVPVRVVDTDGSMTELLEGDIQPGDELVTGVIIPQIAPQTGPKNPFVGNQPRPPGFPQGPGPGNQPAQSGNQGGNQGRGGNQSGGGRGGG